MLRFALIRPDGEALLVDIAVVLVLVTNPQRLCTLVSVLVTFNNYQEETQTSPFHIVMNLV